MGAPAGSLDAGTWVDDDARRNAVSLSLQLLPFAGIAFLWFIGVLRDRIGSGEDRFFATVFLGSGLLFVAMFFVSGAMAAGLISTAAEASAGRLGSVWPFGRRSAASLAADLRPADGGRVHHLGDHAGHATAGSSPDGSRCSATPPPPCCSSASVSCRGSQLVFPGWVFVLSVHLLIVTFRRRRLDRRPPRHPSTDDRH